MHASSGLLGEESCSYKRLPLKCGQCTGLTLPCPKYGEEILELVATPGLRFLGPSSSNAGFMTEMFQEAVHGTCLRRCMRECFLKRDRFKWTAQKDELSDEVGRLQGQVHDVDALKIYTGGFNAKLKKLEALGQTRVVCCCVVIVFVVVGVISMLLKQN